MWGGRALQAPDSFFYSKNIKKNIKNVRKNIKNSEIESPMKLEGLTPIREYLKLLVFSIVSLFAPIFRNLPARTHAQQHPTDDPLGWAFAKIVALTMQ